MNNKIKYIDTYNKKKYKMYQFRVKKDDVDMISFIDSLKNRNNYILDLVSNKKSVLTLKEIKSIILPILRKHNINEVYLFGSYARGEATSKSDVDIYCEQGDVSTLIKLTSLHKDLEEALNKNVDLIFTTDIIKPHFEENMRKDLIQLC